MKIEIHKNQLLKSPDDKITGLYLIHHIHHFGSRNKIKHELHHCFLFSKKNMEGEKYLVIHKMDNKEVCHCVDRRFEGILYDHHDNVFKIVPKKLNNKKIYEIKL